MHDKPQVPPVTLAGTEVRSLVSTAVEGMEYKIFIALPKGYDASSERYAVLYCLDAWNHFGIITETYRLLRYFNDIEPLLIVGISWEADDAQHLYNRSRDYFPTYVSPKELAEQFGQGLADLIPTSGGAAEFLHFFQDELFPFVEREYRVDPSDRGIFGHSAGGNFTAWVLFNTPEVFQRYLIGSPFLPWDDGLAYKQEAAYAERQSALPAQVFLSIGSEEGEGTVARLERLRDTMEARNYEGLDLAFTVFEGETHMSGLPVTYSRALRVLYGR